MGARPSFVYKTKREKICKYNIYFKQIKISK